MITRLILTMTLVIAAAHASKVDTLNTGPKASLNELTKHAVWKPSISQKKAGASCDDGNCLSDLNCFTKDGKGYKFFRSLSKKIKKQCKKL